MIGIVRGVVMNECNNKRLDLFLKEMYIEDRQEAMKRHPKKDFEELVNILQSKGIKFNTINKNEALRILKDINYYYKLTVYRRNFRKEKSGKYKDLEFSYLVDISNLDRRLQNILLRATLDIEHALKTFLISDITGNNEIDGYDIVERFFHSTIGTANELNDEIILEKLNRDGHYQLKLYQSQKKALSVWGLVEIMTLGEFTRFFEFYYKKYPKAQINLNVISGLLNSIKRIRNCCAHNNTFLFNLYDNVISHPNSLVVDYAKNSKIGPMFYSCAKVHDIMAVLYMHRIFVKSSFLREELYAIFDDFFMQYEKTLYYLDKSNDIVYFCNVLKKVVDSYHSSDKF